MNAGTRGWMGWCLALGAAWGCGDDGAVVGPGADAQAIDAALADAAAGDVADVSDAKACVPTESQSCVCATGGAGVQVCRPDQLGWGTCTCIGVPDAGGDLSDTKPPPDSAGDTKPPPDGAGDTKPPPDSAGDTKPPPDGTGDTTPPPDGMGDTTPPPDGGGVSKEACEQEHCVTEWGACQADADCKALVDCKKTCKGEKTCADACVAKAPAAAATLEKTLGDCSKLNGCGNAAPGPDAGPGPDAP
ncbi:MAG: hypothetical protein ACOYOB_14805 [Myxococcota bacterium]